MTRRDSAALAGRGLDCPPVSGRSGVVRLSVDNMRSRTDDWEYEDWTYSLVTPPRPLPDPACGDTDVHSRDRKWALLEFGIIINAY